MDIIAIIKDIGYEGLVLKSSVFLTAWIVGVPDWIGGALEVSVKLIGLIVGVTLSVLHIVKIMKIRQDYKKDKDDQRERKEVE